MQQIGMLAADLNVNLKELRLKRKRQHFCEKVELCWCVSVCGNVF